MRAIDRFEQAIGKFWLRSKTVLFNLAVLVLGAVVELGSLAPTLQAALGPKWYAWVLFGVGAANIVLRWLTTSPIRAVPRSKAVEQYVARLR